MALPLQPPYRSALQTNARPSGRARRKYTLPADSSIQLDAYAIDQDFEMRIDGNFPPAPKNTQASAAAFNSVSGSGLDDANAILTSYSQPANSGNGLGKFTATFTRVPASWDQFETQLVNFPGWLNTIGTNFRDPLSKPVTVRLRHDYFVIDPAGILTGAGVLDSGGTAIVRVSAKGAIPLLLMTPWLATYPSGTVLPNDEARSLTPAAGVGSYLPTLPTIEQYQYWCSVASTFVAALVGGGTQAWDATHPPVWDGSSSTDHLSGQFRYLDSRLSENFAGNIVERITTYVLAR